MKYSDPKVAQAVYDVLVGIEISHWETCPIQHDPRVVSCKYVGLVRKKREELEAEGVKKYETPTVDIVELLWR